MKISCDLQENLKKLNVVHRKYAVIVENFVKILQNFQYNS